MPTTSSQYQAYAVATQTVAKTRQVVMLYDGAIRFLKQARLAITEKRIEDRFKLLARASEIMIGLQSSIEFTHGGNVAHILDRFYTQMDMRIIAVNFSDEGEKLCDGILDDLKQMRDVWDEIDRNLANSTTLPSAPPNKDDGKEGIAVSV